jgi:hypothetical protein
MPILVSYWEEAILHFPLNHYRSIVSDSRMQAKRGLSFEVITEKAVVDFINRTIEEDASILIYEVQDRYYLRPDIHLLSLDGITDGKVAPFLHSKDMYAFLLEYKPDYWLANDAVHYRPYLQNGILEEVVDKTGSGNSNTIRIGAIQFIRIKERDSRPISGFAGYRQLYKINYE